MDVTTLDRLFLHGFLEEAKLLPPPVGTSFGILALVPTFF